MFGTSKLLLTMENLTTKATNAPSKTAEMPYFKLFIRDELANSHLFSLDHEDYGVFCLLRNLIWATGFVDSDTKKLSKFLRISAKKVEKIKQNISKLFAEKDGKWTIPDLEVQRAKYLKFIEDSRQAGQKSGEIRRKVGSTDDEPPFNDGSSNTNSIIHNSKSKSSKTQKAESHTQNQSASASLENAPGNDASASESESDPPLEDDDFKNYVIALKEAGWDIRNVDRYAKKVAKDPTAHSTVRQFKETRTIDVENQSSISKRGAQKSRENRKSRRDVSENKQSDSNVVDFPTQEKPASFLCDSCGSTEFIPATVIRQRDGVRAANCSRCRKRSGFKAA